ncbi:hypothetical protein ACLOJK_011519 [Asimina triloba]
MVGKMMVVEDVVHLLPSVAGWSVEDSRGVVAVAMEEGVEDLNPLVVTVILGGLDQPTGSLAGARRRQSWLPALVRVMEHRNWCSGGALRSVYLQM